MPKGLLVRQVPRDQSVLLVRPVRPGLKVQSVLREQQVLKV